MPRTIKRARPAEELAKEWGLDLFGPDEVSTVQSHSYHDGPLSGLCHYKGRVHYFERIHKGDEDNDSWRRLFRVYSLTDEDIEAYLYRARKYQVEEPPHRWGVTDLGQKLLYERPWTEERLAHATTLKTPGREDPEKRWFETKLKRPLLGMFRWGQDPTPEMYQWGDFALSLTEDLPLCYASIGPGDDILIEFYHEEKSGGFEICSDGEGVGTLVDHNLSIDDPQWFIGEEFPLSEDNFRRWAARIRNHLVKPG